MLGSYYVIIHLFVWWLGKWTIILPNGGLLVIYHGKVLKQITKNTKNPSICLQEKGLTIQREWQWILAHLSGKKNTSPQGSFVAPPLSLQRFLQGKWCVAGELPKFLFQRPHLTHRTLLYSPPFHLLPPTKQNHGSPTTRTNSIRNPVVLFCFLPPDLKNMSKLEESSPSFLLNFAAILCQGHYWATNTNPLTFHYTRWLIFKIAYHNPNITG